MSNLVLLELPENVRKEFSIDKDGKVFVTRRGLARLCGVKHNNWRRGGSKYTVVIDEYLAQSGLMVVADATSLIISDIEAAEVIGYYAEEQQNPIAKASSRAFRAIGLRTAVQNLLGWKPDPKRRLTAEEIVELCCLPTPTSWEKRFPEEYYQHLSRLTGLVAEGTARPGYWAALTKELIYDYLHPGIYAQIRRCKVESGSWAKLHQYLNPIDGVDILEKHQRRVLHHMQGSANLEQLRTALRQSCTGEYQLVLL